MAIMPQRYEIILTRANKKRQSRKTAADSVVRLSLKTISFYFLATKVQLAWQIQHSEKHILTGLFKAESSS